MVDEDLRITLLLLTLTFNTYTINNELSNVETMQLSQAFVKQYQNALNNVFISIQNVYNESRKIMIWLKIISNLKARIVFLGKKCNWLGIHKFLFGLCAGFFFLFFCSFLLLHAKRMLKVTCRQNKIYFIHLLQTLISSSLNDIACFN